MKTPSTTTVSKGHTLSRRDFLGQSAPAAAALLAGARAILGTAPAAQPAPANRGRPRIGCLSWVFHPLRTGSYPEEAIDLIGELGFEGIELIVNSREDMRDYWTDAKVDQLRKQLARHKLVVSQFVMFQPVVEGLTSLDRAEREQSLDYFERGCRLGQALGAPLINIVAPWARELGKGQGYIPRYYEVSDQRPNQKYRINISEPFDYAALWQRWVETVKALLERTRAHGVKLSLEHHTHCMIEDANAFLRLCDALPDPDLGYNLDLGWTLLQREYPPVAIHKVGRRLVNVHVRDIDRTMRSFPAFGEGVMDYEGMARALRAVGFNGFLSIEQDRHTAMDMKAVCARYLRTMKEVLGV